MRELTKEELRQVPCCGPSRFGVIIFRVLPVSVSLYMHLHFRKLCRCQERPVVSSTYEGWTTCQVWCARHIPAPHVNYAGMKFITEPLE